MPEKYFLVNPTVSHLSNETIEVIAKEKIKRNNDAWHTREQIAEQALKKESTLKCVSGRVVVKVNIESKNYHSFAGGMVIRRERRFNNLNFREVNPSNGFVVSAENIPAGSEILFDYTSIHDSNKIFDYDSGSNDVVFYSIKEEECYAWRIGRNDWMPTKNCEFGLRVFKPYDGTIIGIPPTQIKDTIFVTTGSLTGKVVKTLKGCDYVIIYQNDDGREGNILRFKHSDEPNFQMEEVIGVMDEYTQLVNEGKLLVGLNIKDAAKWIA